MGNGVVWQSTNPSNEPFALAIRNGDNDRFSTLNTAKNRTKLHKRVVLWSIKYEFFMKNTTGILLVLAVKFPIIWFVTIVPIRGHDQQQARKRRNGGMGEWAAQELLEI